MTDEDATNAVVYAAYELPHHIWVTYPVLDQTFETYIGPVAAKIYTPRRIGLSELTTAPTVPGVPRTAWDPASQWTTTYAGFGTDNKTALRRIALELRQGARPIPELHPLHSTDAHAKIHHTTENYLDEWFERVVDWVTVITGEDINTSQPVYDAYLHARGFQAWSGGRWRDAGIRITTPTPRAVTLEAVTAILARVASFEQPPVEHQLRRDAFQAFARADYRKVALDAATAVEACLIHAIECIERDSSLQVTNNVRHSRDRGIVSRSNWLVKNRNGYNEPPQLKQLASLRNDVIHAGAVASRESAAEALEAASCIVEQLGRSVNPLRPVH